MKHGFKDKIQDASVVIIGAGPAGLAAAHQLVKKKRVPVVIEMTDRPGGLARTETYKSYLFDIGGHRFYTKSQPIQKLWEEMLKNDFIKVNRISRIYYKYRYYAYPLRLWTTLMNLGARESVLILGSYLKARVLPYPKEETFEQWVSNRFGRRLYRTFFKTYTEKVWGISCEQIRSDWAAQRIKGLSFLSALSHAIFGGQKAKTLIDAFYYPRKGPAMMWQKFVDAIISEKGDILFRACVNRLHHEKGRITHLTYTHNGHTRRIEVSHVISSASLPQLVAMLDPEPPAPVRQASSSLSFRSFIIIVLIVDQEDLFPDQWIYIHSPHVRVGRIQNFKNWAVDMVPDPSKTSIGMEYFCNQGDDFWMRPDEELVQIALKEISELGLANPEDILDSYIVRQPGAYPVYDRSYESSLLTIRRFLKTLDNLQTIGRSGMHRYNNMDHAMISGMLAAENVLGSSHNLWEINEEADYLES